MNEDIAGIGILIDPLIVGDKIVGISIKIHVVACLAYLCYSYRSNDVNCRASEELGKLLLGPRILALSLSRITLDLDSNKRNKLFRII